MSKKAVYSTRVVSKKVNYRTKVVTMIGTIYSIYNLNKTVPRHGISPRFVAPMDMNASQVPLSDMEDYFDSEDKDSSSISNLNSILKEVDSQTHTHRGICM